MEISVNQLLQSLCAVIKRSRVRWGMRPHPDKRNDRREGLPLS